MMSEHLEQRVVVVGGCGHVGLPLGLAFAHKGLFVTAFDNNLTAVQTVNSGKMPFLETGADAILAENLANGRFKATTDPACVARAEYVVVVIGTPVDEHLNPDPGSIPRAMGPILQYLTDGQLIVLRSTVYPGVTASFERRLAEAGLRVDVAFCPERISQGQALVELADLPQIVSGRTQAAKDRAATLFGLITRDVVSLEPEEAELAKLFTNTWRYIRFAIANQLFMIANDHGLDYEKIRMAVRHKYPRAMDLPSAGFAAGPCLLKDTAQLGAFNDNNFTLGHAATLVNEGLPNYMVSKLSQSYDLASMTVGILGMAYKAESDDQRSSLSYKLKRILSFRANKVLCTDPYVPRDSDLQPLDCVLKESDLLIIGTPHRLYATIETDRPVVDIWNIREQGVLL